MINPGAAVSQAPSANQLSRVQSSPGRRSSPFSTFNSRAIVPKQIERRAITRAAPCGKPTRHRLSSGCTALTATGSGDGSGRTPPAKPVTGGNDDEQPDEGSGAAEDIDGIMAAVGCRTCLIAMASRNHTCRWSHAAEPSVSCVTSTTVLPAGWRQLRRAASGYEGELCFMCAETCMRAEHHPVLHVQRRSICRRLRWRRAH